MRVKFLAQRNNGGLWWGSNSRLTSIHRSRVRRATNCATTDRYPPITSQTRYSLRHDWQVSIDHELDALPTAPRRLTESFISNYLPNIYCIRYIDYEYAIVVVRYVTTQNTDINNICRRAMFYSGKKTRCIFEQVLMREKQLKYLS